MKLDDFLQNYTCVKGQVEERFMTQATAKLVLPMSVNKNILNLGLGNGYLCKILSTQARSLTVVEGSSEIINRFSFDSENVTYVNSYFEKYSTPEKFDLILANHVLEHVNHPVSLMREHFSKWIKQDGIIYITVPNARSIHRLIGKEMGLLNSEYDLNHSDLMAGHQRVYDKDSLIQDITAAGLEVVDMGGYNLKIVSLQQMADWSQDLLNAIFEVSQHMPLDICSNIWVKARLSR